jgi:hypothetical protein
MDARWQLVAYVLVSIILRTVAAQLSQRRTDLVWVRFFSEGWPTSALRFVYYIGLPYVALILGVVPGRYLGLIRPDRLREPASGSTSTFLGQVRDYLSVVALGWLPDLGTIAGLGAILMLFLGVTWLGYSHLRDVVRTESRASRASRRGNKGPGAVSVIYQAVHWSFYRSAVWLLADNLYLGVVGGIVLVGAEWLLDPGWISRLHRAQTRDFLLVDTSVLIATSVIFFFVPNLWLLLPIHWLMATACQRLVVLEQGATTGSRSKDLAYQARD